MKTTGIHIGKQSLHCDGCGADYPIAKLTPDCVNRPCPACGANLLTQADYEEGLRVIAAVEKLAALFGPAPEPKEGETRIALRTQISVKDGAASIKSTDIETS